MTTLNGGAVDRPAVCFYEIDAYRQRFSDPDLYNIYNHPSWKPLLDLARDHSDRIVMVNVPFRDTPPDPIEHLTHRKITEHAGMRQAITTVKAGSRILCERTRRDWELDTVWIEEHLLKDIADLKAYLALPAREFGGFPDPADIEQAEAELGDSGIAMIDTPDPLCLAASLFDMATFTVIAFTEPALFRQLTERFAALLLPQTEAISKTVPGRLWRIYGPEYASPPYLPPRLFREYAVTYVKPMVESIQRYGGFARIHCHGRLKAILDDIAFTGCDGLDPIEPPPLGDVELAYVREYYGQQMVLFGNLEARDIEFLPTAEFTVKIKRALREGTAGKGRGFVLMPSACPYGRILPELALRNYEKMIELAEK